MKHILFSDHSIYSFSRHHRPAVMVESGESIEIHTLDCFANQIQTPEDALDKMDWEKVNPATGPIFIKDAEPGDVLKITIEDIKLNNQGVMACGNGLGVLGNSLKGLVSKIIKIEENKAVFDDKLSLPLRPMIGVIGVAPEGATINSGTPGSHGGNMDNNMITTGAVLYLPVFVDGALFALGDLHAVMGDGEIGVTGVEVAGTVNLKLEVVKGLKLNNPVLENSSLFSTIASAISLDEAVNKCTEDIAELISSRLPLDINEITMLLSAAGNTQICQVVDPLKTARFVIPKWILDTYGFKL